jgi:hypothetical protein
MTWHFNDLLTCIATGLTVEETRKALATFLPVSDLIEARTEAMEQGIEREDVDPSWFDL